MSLCCLSGPTTDDELAAETVEAHPWIFVTVRTCLTCRWSWITRKRVSR